MNADDWKRVEEAIDKAEREGRDPYLAALYEKADIRREKIANRPFIGYSCWHCCRGHLGVDCPERAQAPRFASAMHELTFALLNKKE